ncbi:MAG TPA: MBL fold metallo-hydrolase [Bryobacteraceae bacterium]|nr:MBL fold metallo-hydrolase [Bryobacteraceae bacterium]
MCQRLSRRNFFERVIFGSMAGASILDLASRRAAWAQAMSPGAPIDLFEIQNVADGVFFAFARPQAVTNCNAAIFVNSADVLVVDAHSKPSAAAALIAQIKAQVTTKPVRYLVDTHFHWDHSQGNAGYQRAFGKELKIISSDTTKKLEAEFTAARLRESLDPHGHPFPSQPHIPALLDAARQQLGAAATPEEKARLQDRIRQLESFEREMKNFVPVLPTVTFSKAYVIKDKAHELHVEFHGRAHTAGDVIVYCPQKRVVATGDMILGTLPFLADGYPKEWPKTIDSVAKLELDFVAGGHGGVQHGKQHMTGQRNYIEELAMRVDAGKKAGQSLGEIQRSMPIASIKSLQDGYGASVLAHDPAAAQNAVNTNIEHVFNRLSVV